jgi:magnesium-transporting ATPase (P-type)
MFRGDSAKMGSTVVKGEVEATVETTGGNTFFGKTASLLQSVDGMGHLQMILMRIVLVLVVMSILVSCILLIYLCVNVPPVRLFFAAVVPSRWRFVSFAFFARRRPYSLRKTHPPCDQPTPLPPHIPNTPNTPNTPTKQQ